MTTRGRALRLTAVSTLVVLGLTGFSTSRHGHGHGGDGGGGCSSSSQDHDSSSSSSGGGAYKDDDDAYGTGGTGHHDYDDDTYDDDTSGGSGGTTATPEPATAELLTCATKSAPYATVEITNPNDSTYTFPVTVFFKDTAGTTTSDSREETTIPPRTTTKVRVPLDASTTPDHCELDETEPRPLS